MNRHDIRLLQQVRSYPALTITLPTHRTSPDNQHDPMERLVSEIDFPYGLDGLALFVTQDFARAYQIPFDLQERIEVVLSKQGRVVFVDNAQLAEHRRIALILRY
jgi:hypothetical protein